MRLFIGIPLDTKILNEIYNLSSKFKDFKNIKFVKKENIHITLKFLGETKEDLIENIKKAMDDAFLNEEKFFITTDRISAFPNEKKAKVIWFNINKNSDKIVNLFNKLENKLGLLNIIPEEEYVPHITIARLKEAVDITEKTKDMQFEYKTKIEKIVLFKSVLRPEGPEYSHLYEKILL